MKTYITLELLDRDGDPVFVRVWPCGAWTFKWAEELLPMDREGAIKTTPIEDITREDPRWLLAHCTAIVSAAIASFTK